MSDLYTRLFERTALPLLDRLNGTTIARKLAFLLDNESTDRRSLEREQANKLDRLIERTRQGSDFYRRFWKHNRGERGVGSNHAPLDGLPVLTKPDLEGADRQFPESGYRGRVVVSQTSGSTGSPMRFLRSPEQESWFWALRFRIWQWAGYRPGDPYLTINLNPRLAWKKRVQDVLFRCAYLTYNADNQNSELIADTLERRSIPHLNGFSSSLYVLAQYMLDHGRQNHTVQGVTSTGDGLFPPYRDAIEQCFGVRVLDYYGAGGEGVHLASQCAHSQHRYHLHPENAIVELIGENGPVATGELGRIVVTQLDNDAMPLIRYELGDVGVAAADDLVCGCGRTLPLLERIEGRVPDLVAVPGGTFLVPHFFVVLFKGLQQIYRYQIVQSEAGSMLVRLVPRERCERAVVERAVLAAVDDATRGELGVEFDWVEEIPLSGAGKRRLVDSAVSRALLGAASAPE